jgi:hypothetical protein
VLRGVTTTAALKAATFSALRLLVDREQIEFPASAADLLRELVLLRVDLSPGGDERIAASGAAHDDLAMSLALALGPFRRRDGRWVTLADQAIRQPVPPPRRDASDDAYAFQSVVGDEITSRNPTITPTPVELGGFLIYPGGKR